MSNKKKIKLETGKFYHCYGGGRHPSLIFTKDRSHKTYTSIKFGTTKKKNMIPIKSIDGKNNSYVDKNPFEGTRRDYGDHELLGLKVHPSDNKLMESIKQRKPKQSWRAKSKYNYKK